MANKNEGQKKQVDLKTWIKSQEGEKAIISALEKSTKETARLEKVRTIDPKKLVKVITV